MTSKPVENELHVSPDTNF